MVVGAVLGTGVQTNNDQGPQSKSAILDLFTSHHTWLLMECADSIAELKTYAFDKAEGCMYGVDALYLSKVKTG